MASVKVAESVLKIEAADSSKGKASVKRELDNTLKGLPYIPSEFAQKWLGEVIPQGAAPKKSKGEPSKPKAKAKAGGAASSA